MHDYKTLLRRAGAVLFWLAVWQAAAMAIGQEVFLVSPVQALRCLLRLLPQADFWHRVGFSAGRVSAVFQEDRLCPQLTAVQNVLLVLPDDRQEAAIRQDFARLGLDEAALALPARKLSGGQKRRTALLRALWAPGDTLLLDEPFTGMDPAAVQASIALLRERVEGRPVLLATHDRAAIDALGWPMLELQKLAQPGAACNSTNKGLQ